MSGRPAAIQAGIYRGRAMHHYESPEIPSMGMQERPGLTAADLMTPSPRTCSPFSTVLEAVMVFRDCDCGAMPVVEAGQPVGILTDRDVALALGQFPDLERRPVADIMTRGVVTTAPDAPLAEVKAKLGDHGLRRLLVVDPAGQLRGILSWVDLIPHVPDEKLGRVVSEIAEQR